MTDYEVDRALGYSPCVCGVIDGTWHPECFREKRTKEQRAAAYKRAYAAARRHLKKQAADAASAAMDRAATPKGGA